MLNLLKKEKLLNYNHVYVYSSTLYQPAYEHLKSYYGTLEQLISIEIFKVVKIAHFFDADDEILNHTYLDKSKNQVMTFDDVMLKDPSVIEGYFCRGRHNDVSVFYLCQSLHTIAKHCIRENANMFIQFK